MLQAWAILIWQQGVWRYLRIGYSVVPRFRILIISGLGARLFILFMKKCALCSVELKLLNTPTFGLGRLKDGQEICYSCLKSLNANDQNIGLKLKQYSLKDIRNLQRQNTHKEIKEYKITCIACENIRFIPYFEFKDDSLTEKPKTFFENMLVTLGLASCCLPLGCASALISTNEILDSKTSEEKLDKYFELHKVNRCNKCGSMAKYIEVIIHKI